MPFGVVRGVGRGMGDLDGIHTPKGKKRFRWFFWSTVRWIKPTFLSAFERTTNIRYRVVCTNDHFTKKDSGHFKL